MKNLLLFTLLFLSFNSYSQKTIIVEDTKDSKFIAYKDSLQAFLKYYDKVTKLYDDLNKTTNAKDFIRIADEAKNMYSNSFKPKNLLISKTFVEESKCFCSSSKEMTYNVFVNSQILPVNTVVYKPKTKVEDLVITKAIQIENKTYKPERTAELSYYTKKPNGQLVRDSVEIRRLNN